MCPEASAARRRCAARHPLAAPRTLAAHHRLAALHQLAALHPLAALHRLGLLALLGLLAVRAAAAEPAGLPRDPVELDIRAPGIERVELARGADGGFRYAVQLRDGRELALDAEGFTRLLHEHARAPSVTERLLNVRSAGGLAWVALGLLGQLAFTGRMLWQWLASERQGRSVVPVAFWWMSLGGAALLLAYFVWRRDVVGVLGQSAGFLIYARNLWLIRRGRAPALTV